MTPSGSRQAEFSEGRLESGTPAQERAKLEACVRRLRDRFAEESAVFAAAGEQLGRGFLPASEVPDSLLTLRSEFEQLSADILTFLQSLGATPPTSMTTLDDMDEALRQALEQHHAMAALTVATSVVQRVLPITTRDPDVGVSLVAEQERAGTLLAGLSQSADEVASLAAGEHPYCQLLATIAGRSTLSFPDRINARKALERSLGIELAEAALGGDLGLPNEPALRPSPHVQVITGEDGELTAQPAAPRVDDAIVPELDRPVQACATPSELDHDTPAVAPAEHV